MKRQVKQGGLTAVRVGLSEELRSDAIPAPLRGAAQRIAKLLDRDGPQVQATVYEATYETRSADAVPRAARPAAGTASGTTASAAASESPLREVPLPKPDLRAPEEVAAAIASVVVSAPLEASVDSVVSVTGTDSGQEPPEPEPDAAVDPLVVGATPTFNATPVDVDVIDATPVDAGPLDASEGAVVIEPPPRAPHAEEDEEQTESAVAERASEAEGTVAETAQVAPTDGAAADAGSKTKSKPRVNASRRRTATGHSAGNAQNEKEKLATDVGAAKSVARSTSRSAKRRPGARAEPTSKKK